MDDKKPNPLIHKLEEAQTEIRLTVKDAFMRNLSKDAVNKRLDDIIFTAVQGITIARLRTDATKSLWNFANKQRITWANAGLSPNILTLVTLGMAGKPTALAEQRLTPYEIGQLGGEKLTYAQHQKGVPLQEYYQTVWKDKVKPVLDDLCNQNALDPNDLRGRNSLRNLAEMEVRYQEHKDSIKALRDSGARLVICSAHADCSPRCKPYQGRIYSLDGTKGTINGSQYVPLEEATENPSDLYTTKAGRTYQNGLLGFNCRHKLYEYKGQAIPRVSEEERRREYEITKTQREYEREIRRLKTESLMNRGINDKLARVQRQKYKALYNEYAEYCRSNKRAFYPMRVQI